MRKELWPAHRLELPHSRWSTRSHPRQWPSLVLCGTGVVLVDGGTIRLSRMIGLSCALDLILTGRLVGTNEALEMGLANGVTGISHKLTFDLDKLSS